MASVYTASALLLLSLPQGLATPLNYEAPIADVQDSIPPTLQVLDAKPSVAPALSSHTGKISAQIEPLVLSAPSPSRAPIPGPAPGTTDVSPLTGGVVTSPDISKTLVPTIPLNPSIGDGTFPGQALPLPIEPGIGDHTDPEAFGDPISMILSDPISPKVKPPVAPPAVHPTIPEIIKDPPLPQVLSAESFLAIVQQLADVISGFFTIQPGQPHPPIQIASVDIFPTPPASSPIPVLRVDKRQLSSEQQQLISEIAAKNVILQKAINSLKTLRAAKHVELHGRSDTFEMGELLNNFGGLGGPPNIAKPLAETPKSSSNSRATWATLSSISRASSTAMLSDISWASPSVTLSSISWASPSATRSSISKASPSTLSAVKSSVKASKPVTETTSTAVATTKPKPDPWIPTFSLELVQELVAMIQKLLNLAAPSFKLSPLERSESINKRETPRYVFQLVRDFIKRFHTIGASLADHDPSLVADLKKVFQDPEIDQDSKPDLGEYPEAVRKFVLDYYTLAQILTDVGVSTDDKTDLFRVLFDGSGPYALPKRDVASHDDGPDWNEKKLKDFIKLFWTIDPRINVLDKDLQDQLVSPLTDGSTDKPWYNSEGEDQDTASQVKNAAVQWIKFRKFFDSLPDDERAELIEVLQAGQNPADSRKRSMRHGLRRRQPAYPSGYSPEHPSQYAPKYPPGHPTKYPSGHPSGQTHHKDLGAELDDAKKLGPILTALLGPGGTMDPMGMIDSGKDADHVATRPFYDPESNHVKSNTHSELENYETQSNEYTGNYDDADDAAAGFWDPYSQIDEHAGEYDGVAGARQNWACKSR